MENFYLPEGMFCDTGRCKYTLDELERAMFEGRVLQAKATVCDKDRNLHVDLGFCTGIIPKEEVLYNPSGLPVKDIAVITRVGKYVSFVVTDIEDDGCGTKVTLSRKLAQMECCENYVKYLKSGDVIRVTVTHMEPFGVFCDIGCGVAALLPIDCISVSRIGHPKERFFAGQKIKCVVRNVERDICRVTLTHKELLGTWQENADMFSPGDTVCGIVRSIEPYGVFVELAPNLAGLAEYCEEAVEGSTAAVYIKSIIPEKMKIKLVIVDASPVRCDRVSGEYFFEGKHMDEWRYSPKESVKQIYTDFCDIE